MKIQKCLIMLVGAPGSGKSEWARRNAAGALLVGQDELIEAITPNGFDPACRPVYAAAEEAIAAAGLNANYPVIIDRTNRTRALRRRWLELAARCRCEAIAIAMTASEELCRTRNRERADHRRVSDQRMERMLRALEPPTTEEGFVAVFPENESSLESILGFLSNMSHASRASSRGV
jgi:predicted kinase